MCASSASRSSSHGSGVYDARAIAHVKARAERASASAAKVNVRRRLIYWGYCSRLVRLPPESRRGLADLGGEPPLAQAELPLARGFDGDDRPAQVAAIPQRDLPLDLFALPPDGRRYGVAGC